MTSGIVTITGRLERRAVARDLISAIQHVIGVVGVRDRVAYPPGDATILGTCDGARPDGT